MGGNKVTERNKERGGDDLMSSNKFVSGDGDGNI